ncbi:MAG: Do family serine endopeptidase [Alphaproteobacteria bacterium]
MLVLRKCFSVPVFWALIVLFSVNVEASSLRFSSTPESFAPLTAKLLPAVVNIATKKGAALQTQQNAQPIFPPGHPLAKKPRTSQGSGFIIDPAGFIVTNAHVIGDAEEIEVTLSDDRKLVAEIIGIDKKTDIALLKVPTQKALPFVEWGSSDKMRVGDWILVIGNPFGLGGTVTSGIISARARDIHAGPYDDFIQTDAAINKGNSGGPMFNMDGDVIGINSAIITPSGGSVGIGFAIPSGIAETVVAQLKKYGRTRRGWLGVKVQPVTSAIAEGLGLKKEKGALVSNVTVNSPAAHAGIIAGDVILRLNDIYVKDIRHLPKIVAEMPIQSVVRLQVWRNGALKTLQAKLGELEVAENIRPHSKKKKNKVIGKDVLGFSVSSVTTQLRRTHKIPSNVNGIMITGVGNNGASVEAGLLVGDVIIKAHQTAVRSAQNFVKVIARAQQQNKKTILLWIYRRGERLFLPLSIRNN